MNTLDILILIFLACTIIYAITYNVNLTLNEKLSNVAVNIPPITIPSPIVTVKIQKTDNSYDVFIENSNVGQPAQIVSLSPDPQKNHIEEFGQLSQVVNNSNLSSNSAQSETMHFQPNTKMNKIVHDTTVKQTQQFCNKHTPFSKMTPYGRMFENSTGINDHVYPLCVANSNDLGGNIISDDGSEDYVVNEYRKYQQYVKTYLEDPVIRGYNINNYDNSTNLLGVGKIELMNGETQPKPSGFVFQTSPAYIR